MKVKILKIVAALLLFASQMTAQMDGFRDKVYLTNGSRVVGKIIFYQPNDTLKLQLEGGQITYFSPQQIKKIDMFSPAETRAEKPYNFREHGFYGAATYSLNFGRHDDIYVVSSGALHLGVGLQAVGGWQFRRQIGAGLGVGYDMYYVGNGNANVLSVFGEARGYLNPKNQSAFWTLAAGFGLPLKNKNETLTSLGGGFLLRPTIGWRFGASARCNLFIDFGAQFQTVRYDQVFNEYYENHYTVVYRRWILRGGILF